MLPRVPRAVVFDMDGLLFDTEALYRRTFVAAGTEVGCVASDDMFLALVGTPWTLGRAMLLERHGPAYPVDRLAEVWMRRFKELAETDLAMKPGVSELLDRLDALALPRAIATSSSRRTADHHLAAHALTHRFHALACEGDYARGKPAPDPFLEAARRLGVDPAHCLALEDSHHGVRAAHAAGMMAIMIPDLIPPTEELRKLALVLPSLHEVRRLLD